MKKKLFTLLISLLSVVALAGCTQAGTSTEGDSQDFYLAYEDEVYYKICHLQYVKFAIPMSVIGDMSKSGQVNYDSMKVYTDGYLISETKAPSNLFNKSGKEQTAKNLERVFGEDYSVDAQPGRMMISEDGVCKAIFPMEYKDFSGWVSLISKDDEAYVLAAVTKSGAVLDNYDVDYMMRSLDLCSCTDYATLDPMFMYDDGSNMSGTYVPIDEDGNLDWNNSTSGTTGDDDWWYGADDDELEGEEIFGGKVVGDSNLGYMEIPQDFEEVTLPDEVNVYMRQYANADETAFLTIGCFGKNVTAEQYAQNAYDIYYNDNPDGYAVINDTYFIGHKAYEFYAEYDTDIAKDVVVMYTFEDDLGDTIVLISEAPTVTEAYDYADYLYSFTR